MNGFQIAILVIGSMINSVLFSVFPVFIYCIVKYQPFRAWVVQLIEDGDGIAHKADAKDALLLFFAGMMGWVLINIILLSLFFEKDMLPLIGTVSLITGGMFGIGKLGEKK